MAHDGEEGTTSPAANPIAGSSAGEEQPHERDHRDGGEVLEQEHREASVAGIELAVLVVLNICRTKAVEDSAAPGR